MIVEDQNIVARDLRSALMGMGYHVPAVASSGEEAIEWAEAHRPDLVLMDVVLQGDIDGIEAAARIRERFDIPVIYLTAYADHDTLERAKRTEPLGYVMKPFEETDLYTTIEVALHKHEMDRKVKESEERYFDLYENAPDLYATIDARTQIITQCNRACAESLGRPKDRVIGSSVAAMYAAACATKASALFDRFLQSGDIRNEELILQRADGSTIDVSVNMTAVRDSHGRIVAARTVWRDITERRRIEREREQLLKQLSGTNEELTALSHVTSVAISTLDLEDLFTVVLDRIESTMKVDIALAFIVDGDHLVVRAGIDPSERDGYGFRFQIGDGFAGTVAATRTTRTVRDAQATPEVEVPYLRRRGYRTLVASPMIHNDRLIGVLEVGWLEIRSHTEREIRLLEAMANRCAIAIANAQLYEEMKQLHRELDKRVQERTTALTEANKELEAFSYSVSHDLRAPLRAINGFASALMEDYADKLDTQGKNYLDIIKLNTRAMSQLIDDLLAFSRLGRKELSTHPIDMNELVNAVVADVRKMEPDHAPSVTIQDLPPAVGDGAMVKQVLHNLIANAFKFTRFQLHPEITIGSRSLDGRVEYFVSDNGVGFDPAYTHKLFGVFQRLHTPEEFEGTGVGLAIVKRIVQRHGGKIWAVGEIDTGATFTFTLS
jgi:PAS domain S-box-containing protein